jgi:hypothetical protein
LGNGLPGYRSRAGLLGRRDPLDGDQDSYFVHLRETSLTEVKAWCPRCGGRPVAVADLLAAVDGRRSKVVLL